MARVILWKTRQRRPVARRPRRARNYGMNKVKPLKGFTKLQTVALKKAIGRNEETKYTATNLWDGVGLDGAIHSIGLPGAIADTMPLVPQILPGAAENQRIGRKVKPVKCCVDVSVSFNMNGEAPTGQNTQQIYVYLYMLRSKTVKSYGQFVGTDNWNHWADNGDGTSTFFGYTDTATPPNFFTDYLAFQKPVETSEVSLVKRVRIKLTKNNGIMNGSTVAGSNPNLSTSSYSGRFYYRLPELVWDDTNSKNQGFPSNNNTFIAVGACLADNTDGLYSNDSAKFTISARQHVWFKDA